MGAKRKKNPAVRRSHFHLRLFTRKPLDIKTDLAGLLAWFTVEYLPVLAFQNSGMKIQQARGDET